MKTIRFKKALTSSESLNHSIKRIILILFSNTKAMQKFFGILILFPFFRLVYSETLSNPKKILDEMHNKICAKRSLVPILEYIDPDRAEVYAMVVGRSLQNGSAFKNELEKRCKSGFKSTSEQISGNFALVGVENDSPTLFKKINEKWRVVEWRASKEVAEKWLPSSSAIENRL